MIRRTPTLGVLVLVGVVLCLSLGAALARSAPSALLTPTALPIFDQAAYLPLLMKHTEPPATSTATAVSTAIPSVTSTATSSVTNTATNTATSTATNTATTTAEPTNTSTSTATTTAEPTGTASSTTTNTATSTAAPTSTALNTATSTTEPTNTSTSTATSTAAPTSTSTSTATATATGTATNTATSTAESTSTATSTATIPPTATTPPTATATATATVPPVYNACINNTFPIAVNKLALQENRPYWYKPVTLGSVNIAPFESDQNIPSLNTTNSRSPRFRVYANYNGVGPTYSWARWNGAEASGSSQDLSTALTGNGNLADGFSEFTPPASDPAAIPLVNGRLEAGDWLAGTGATASTTAAQNALNYHIAQKTMLVLPVYDSFVGNGGSADSGYHVVGFIQVRLLSYQLAPSSQAYLEFALVNDNHLCALELTVGDHLEWYAPVAVEGNYDIVIVQDYSISMRSCWDTTATCTTGSRRIDYAAGVLRSLVDEVLNKRNLQQGGEHRLAYVTFSQGATKRVPFIDDTNAALAAFKNQIGDLANPKVIANTELLGNTNTAAGLASARSYLYGARTIDSRGNPVKLVVVLLTDGLTNVFNDGGMQNISNKYTEGPFYCGDNLQDMDNPYVQSTCPSAAEFPNITPRPLPPVQAMVKVANDARAAWPQIMFHALVLGNQFGLTPVDMHLNEVAPDNYAMANSPAELASLMDSMAGEFFEIPCQKFTAWIPSPGIHVVIRDQNGTVVSEGDSGAGGMYRARLPYNPQDQYGDVSGFYTVEAVHNDVVAPDDPYQIARDYAGGRNVVFVEIGANWENIGLGNTDPTNAQCP